MKTESLTRSELGNLTRARSIRLFFSFLLLVNLTVPAAGLRLGVAESLLRGMRTYGRYNPRWGSWTMGMPVVRMGLPGNDIAEISVLPEIRSRNIPDQEKSKREYDSFSHDNAGTEYLGKRSNLPTWPEASK